jgi:hypothetical protein
MVLGGTRLLAAKVAAGQHGEMEQVVRRGVHKLVLPAMPTRGDLEAIFERAGLEFPDRREEVQAGAVRERPYEVVRQLAKQEGLKSICERLRYAAMLAGKDGRELSWEHFVRAHLTILSGQQPEPDWD